jgi:hypothetical protein
VFLFGLVAVLGAVGLGGWACWATRSVTVHVELAGYAWTGRLYGVLLMGAVLAGWFFLGAACIQLRLRERRERKAARAARASVQEPAVPSQRNAAAVTSRQVPSGPAHAAGAR